MSLELFGLMTLNEKSKLITTKEINNKAKEVLMPVGPNVSILANSEYPISKRRKLLQEVQVGNCSSSISH